MGMYGQGGHGQTTHQLCGDIMCEELAFPTPPFYLLSWLHSLGMVGLELRTLLGLPFLQGGVIH